MFITSSSFRFHTYHSVCRALPLLMRVLQQVEKAILVFHFFTLLWLILLSYVVPSVLPVDRQTKNTGRIECSTGRSTSMSSQLLTVLGSLIFRSPPLARLKVDDIQLEIVTPDSSVQLQNDYSKPFCVLQEPRSEVIAFGVTSSVCLL